MPNEFSTDFSTACGKLRFIKGFGFYANEKIGKGKKKKKKSKAANAADQINAVRTKNNENKTSP